MTRTELIIQLLKVAIGLAFAAYFVWWSLQELARAGERCPDLLCEGALKTLSGNLFGD
jgi:hypothetical protein